MGILAATGGLSADDLTRLLLGLAVLLGLARVLGEVAQRFGQPSIIGEILAGLIVGKTMLGAFAPEAYQYLFPTDGSNTGLVLQGLIVLSAAFLLLVAGLEVDLSSVARQGMNTVWVAVMSMLPPLVVGTVVAYFFAGYFDMGPDASLLPFALFVGIALSITALPVIAKILMDLNLLRTDLGMLIMSAAMIIDILGWVGFAVIKALMSGGGGGDNLFESLIYIGPILIAAYIIHRLSIRFAPEAWKMLRWPIAILTTGGIVLIVMLRGDATTQLIGQTFAFLFLMLTVVRLACHRVLPYIQAHWSWPGGVIGSILIFSIFCAAATEWIGIHSIFGAFVAGVAIGDSNHLRARTQETLTQFITSIFAPLFFASIALRVDFVARFDFMLVTVALTIAMVGKVGGTYIGGRIAKIDPRESLAVGFGMAAQGSMGVILGQLAYDADLIGPRLFEAIIITAIVTSLISGPAILRILRPAKPRSLGDHLPERNYIPDLWATSVKDAIGKLANVASQRTEIPMNTIFDAVWQREQIMHTSLGRGMAVPHARMDQIEKPLVILARSPAGVDWDSPDGEPARIICLLLTPTRDANAQIELLGLFARAFGDRNSREAAMKASSYTELLAAIKLPGESMDEAEVEESPKPTSVPVRPQNEGD